MDELALPAIERLLTDFAWYADHGAWEQLATLFTDEGTLVLNGHVMVGRAQIVAELTQRAQGSSRLTRHVWSNLRVESLAADQAQTTISQLTFEQSEPGAAVQVRFSDVSDTFMRDAQGQWHFSQRRIARVMTTG